MILLTFCPFIFTIIYHTPFYEYSTIYSDSVLKCCQSVAITNHTANILLLVLWKAGTRLTLGYIPMGGIIGNY